MTNTVDQSMIESVAARDRRLQEYLAAARGPVRNADLLAQLTDAMCRARGEIRGTNGSRAVENALIDVMIITTDVLTRIGCPHAITGSVASGVFGEPIVSQDVDIILRATPQQAVLIGKALAPRFYAPEERLAEAATRGEMMNVIDVGTSLKLDLSFIRDNAFLEKVLIRSIEHSFGTSEHMFRFVTPEDIILMKLEWRKESKSPKQWDNALSVMRIQRNKLDWKYMYQQAETLELTDDLVRMRDEAGI